MIYLYLCNLRVSVVIFFFKSTIAKDFKQATEGLSSLKSMSAWDDNIVRNIKDIVAKKCHQKQKGGKKKY